MKIAVVGAGVAGLTAAYALSPAHDVTLYEAAERLGGHAHTQRVRLGERWLDVDTGFLVYNERTYPNFTRLLAELDVATQPSEMSFSVCDETSGLEYNGHSLNTLFAQRTNLARPAFWRLLWDIVRFNRAARHLAETGDERWSLGEFLDRGRFGRLFSSHYLLPMAGAIWSCEPAQVRDFPALFLARFYRNHGLLDLHDRPQWRTISGGSQEYVARIAARLGRSVRLHARVVRVQRHAGGVLVQTERGTRDEHDWVVLALHGDQALRVLAEPTTAEREILGPLRYQRSEAVLHTDERLLPRRPLARASWNYRAGARSQHGPAVTYWLNRLQNLVGPEQLCVTLNQADQIAPERVLARMGYEHPVYDRASAAARQRWSEINGRQRTSYCGAYWRNGFHEDGVVSAVRVCQALGVQPAFAVDDFEAGPPSVPAHVPPTWVAAEVAS